MGSRWNAASGASGYPKGSAIKRKDHTEKWHKRTRKYHSEKWHVEQAHRGHHGKKEKYMKRKTDSQKRQTNTKAELKSTRLTGPTEEHMYLAVDQTGFAHSLDDPLLT